MKDRLRSYFYHSSVESRGITVLLTLLAVALTITAFTMHYFIPRISSLKEDTALSRAWNIYKASQHSSIDAATTSTPIEGRLFSFDPNTLDSTGFIELGLRPVTTHLLLNWRRKGKVFYKREDLKKLYTLTPVEYERLAPFIVFRKPPENEYADMQSWGKSYDKPPDHIDINTTDSATLVKLKGIGPYFAHKLIEKRNELGGYLKHEQLMEAYRFNDSTYSMLREKLLINKQAVRKIRINLASEEQLRVHPYIGEKMAKNIILYRNAIKRFEKIEQLKQAPLMNEEIYRKIAPYLSTE